MHFNGVYRPSSVVVIEGGVQDTSDPVTRDEKLGAWKEPDTAGNIKLLHDRFNVSGG